jgi:hypothetical protein
MITREEISFHLELIRVRVPHHAPFISSRDRLFLFLFLFVVGRLQTALSRLNQTLCVLDKYDYCSLQRGQYVVFFGFFDLENFHRLAGMGQRFKDFHVQTGVVVILALWKYEHLEVINGPRHDLAAIRDCFKALPRAASPDKGGRQRLDGLDFFLQFRRDRLDIRVTSRHHDGWIDL